MPTTSLAERSRRRAPTCRPRPAVRWRDAHRAALPLDGVRRHGGAGRGRRARRPRARSSCSRSPITTPARSRSPSAARSVASRFLVRSRRHRPHDPRARLRSRRRRLERARRQARRSARGAAQPAARDGGPTHAARDPGSTSSRSLAAAAGRSVGRPDLARAMVASGAASSMKDAFARHLFDGGPVDVPHHALPLVGDALALGRSAGAAMSLAHPHVYDHLGVFVAPAASRRRARWCRGVLRRLRSTANAATGSSSPTSSASCAPAAPTGTATPMPTSASTLPDDRASKLLAWLDSRTLIVASTSASPRRQQTRGMRKHALLLSIACGCTDASTPQASIRAWTTSASATAKRWSTSSGSRARGT